MTLLTAGALTDPRLPATASNVCTTDARLGGVGRVPPPPPPNKTENYCKMERNYWYYYWLHTSSQLWGSATGQIPNASTVINISSLQ